MMAVRSMSRSVESFVGTGGWAYFDVPGRDALTAYARIFPFVEVNATFYEHPDPRTVAAWRRRVPPSFRFAVRAHRDVTHRLRLRATPGARTSFARTAAIAARLDAVAIVLETPETVRPIPTDLQDLLSTAKLPCPVALEARAFRGRPVPARLAAVMEANDVADVTDFSRQAPRTESSIAYGRMFGLGERNRWEFTDEELASVRSNAEKGDRARVVYAFHGVRMYKDAGRFLTYVRTGAFPRATLQVGLASLESILAADAAFPATRTELLRDHGFRVVDMRTDRRIHAHELLDRLPAGRFGSARAVVSALAAKPALGAIVGDVSPGPRIGGLSR